VLKTKRTIRGRLFLLASCLRSRVRVFFGSLRGLHPVHNESTLILVSYSGYESYHSSFPDLPFPESVISINQQVGLEKMFDEQDTHCQMQQCKNAICRENT
jgi:hypothetical protein